MAPPSLPKVYLREFIVPPSSSSHELPRSSEEAGSNSWSTGFEVVEGRRTRRAAKRGSDHIVADQVITIPSRAVRGRCVVGGVGRIPYYAQLDAERNACALVSAPPVGCSVSNTTLPSGGAVPHTAGCSGGLNDRTQGAVEGGGGYHNNMHNNKARNSVGMALLWVKRGSVIILAGRT